MLAETLKTDGRTQRNVELMWADRTSGAGLQDDRPALYRDNGPAARNVWCRLVELCRRRTLPSSDMVVVENSKFKAVNGCGRKFTAGKIDRRQQ